MIRIGNGYDVHRLKEGRRLVLGGVEIKHSHGLDGHSDADVLVHAVIDALLGAAALGDIGGLFPDTDDRYLGADSLMLLEKTVALLRKNGFEICNIDSIVVAQKPKIAQYIQQMRKNIASHAGIPAERVSVKATTEEGLGLTGRMEGISSQAVCLISKE